VDVLPSGFYFISQTAASPPHWQDGLAPGVSKSWLFGYPNGPSVFYIINPKIFIFK